MTLKRADIGVPYVLRVACPSCDMPINHPCINTKREPLPLVTSHALRWTLAQRTAQSTPVRIVIDEVEHIAQYHDNRHRLGEGYQLDDGTFITHTNYTWLAWVENEK